MPHLISFIVDYFKNARWEKSPPPLHLTLRFKMISGLCSWKLLYGWTHLYSWRYICVSCRTKLAVRSVARYIYPLHKTIYMWKRILTYWKLYLPACVNTPFQVWLREYFWIVWILNTVFLMLMVTVRFLGSFIVLVKIKAIIELGSDIFQSLRHQNKVNR